MNATQVELGGNTMGGGAAGTIRWMAYELLAETEKYTKHTKETDVWAFGMTVYELLAKERPYAQISIETQVIISVMRRLLPKPPASLDTWPKKKKEAWGICTSCWIVDPNQRVTMAGVVERLKAMRHSLLDVDNVLAEMKHLDLTGFISYDRTNTFTSGTYSDMYAGKYYPEGMAGIGAGRLVSVKRYRPNALGPQDSPQLANELQVWSPLKHSNILQFVGYIREQDGSHSLVSEWMGDKTLLRFIRGNYGRNRLHTISGIAEGLAYLHEQDENIIMCSTGNAIICGLELAHKVGSVIPEDRESADPDTPIGSIRWMAIELIANPEGGYALHSKASDVWAFAMTVYETLAETTPYSWIPRDVQFIIRIVQGELPVKPQSHEVWPTYKETLWKLCESCWNKNPGNRPLMKDIVASLKAIRIQADKVRDRYSGDLVRPPANKAQE
ncbi:hypothetical protein M0805_008734 [Coniferiporia weirii]|nr:hypothetical protein M0805_008734 [Coniferiporia weirii]